jgi:hypothetical protein
MNEKLVSKPNQTAGVKEPVWRASLYNCFFDPRDRACAILDRHRKLVLGSEPILDRYDSAVSRVRELATYGVVRVAVANAEATPRA